MGSLGEGKILKRSVESIYGFWAVGWLGFMTRHHIWSGGVGVEFSIEDAAEFWFHLVTPSTLTENNGH